MRTFTFVIVLAVITSCVQADVRAKISPEFAGKPAGKHKAVVVKKDSKRPGGISFRRTEVTEAEAQKLASDASVIAIMRNKTIKVPPVPGPRSAWYHMPLWDKTGIDQKPLTPAMWLAKDIHNAPAAWKSGYTGAGVKIAVVDEGIDWGHPDLQGCQARVNNPSSPYHGWPIAFDPNAMAWYALHGTATGGYVDTSQILTEQENEGFKLTGTSKSGIYHTGWHGSYWLPFIINPWGRQAQVLVVDENIPGVYDTVYVDINKDLDFRNDKPCRKGDEIACWDKNGDGLADYSAGMLYFIADGKTPIPASDWLFNLPPPENGCLVAFAGAFAKNEAHGTLVASAISARGKSGTTYKIPQKPDDSGAVYGVAPGAEIIQVGSIYESLADIYDSILFSVLGYDGIPGTGDEANVVNMSFGISSEDQDGWDFLSRYITHLNNTIAPATTFVAASGNGGPGYGTVNSPGGSSSAVTVGAVTMYGSTDVYDRIKSADQILYGDIQQWSNRGPNALGQVKPDVVAVGAWAIGCIPVYGSGEGSIMVWAGTSLSAPITSGVLSLIYEAYHKQFGHYPDHREARNLLMSGAIDLGYNVFEQGAGMADASRSTQLASGADGILVEPSSWAAGSPGRETASAFPSAMMPGEVAEKTFTVTNIGNKTVKFSASSRRLVRTGGASFQLTSRDYAEDSVALISKPDYIVDLTRLVPKKTDLLRIRISYPYDFFCLTAPSFRDLRPANLWNVSVYDWTDINRDGRIWTDTNRNEVINDGEFQEGEANRFMLGSPASDVIELSVKEPMSRIHDGLILGLIHLSNNPAIPFTNLKVELEFYEQADWDWLKVKPNTRHARPGESIDVPVTLRVPPNTPPGVYAGSLVVSESQQHVNVPISVVVLPGAKNKKLAAPTLVNGPDGRRDSHDNGVMFGAFDWSWREESGDWRMYYLDILQQRPGGKSFILANATWDDVPSDMDILISRPNREDYFSSTMPEVFGPYGLTRSGESRRTNTGGGVWPFETATGGASEWVAGESAPGLNLIQLHNVLSSGHSGADPFRLKAGEVWLQPSELELSHGQTTATLSLTSSMPLDGLSAIAFGMKPPLVLSNQPIYQDIWQIPSTAKWHRTLSLSRAGLLDITISSSQENDLDLYLLCDMDLNGKFDWDTEMVAVSAGPTSDERIWRVLPPDGQYMVAVHAYKVADQSPFNISIAAVEGTDIGVTLPQGPVAPGVPQIINLNLPPAIPGAQGIVYIGPPDAPGVIPIPLRVK